MLVSYLLLKEEGKIFSGVLISPYCFYSKNTHYRRSEETKWPLLRKSKGRKIDLLSVNLPVPLDPVVTLIVLRLGRKVGSTKLKEVYLFQFT